MLFWNRPRPDACGYLPTHNFMFCWPCIPVQSFKQSRLGAQFFSMFMSFLYVFRATMGSSSGETTVFLRHLVLVILYFTLHTRQSSTQNNKYQMSHKYSCFSWWWAYSRPKRVEKRNKHTKKSCAPSWLYLQDYSQFLTISSQHSKLKQGV
jgi:hypothetical protein